MSNTDQIAALRAELQTAIDLGMTNAKLGTAALARAEKAEAAAVAWAGKCGTAHGDIALLEAALEESNTLLVAAAIEPRLAAEFYAQIDANRSVLLKVKR